MNLWNNSSHITGVPEPVVMILSLMFNQTYVGVLIGDYLSEEWVIGNGVRQGGVLSSFLFSLRAKRSERERASGASFT